MGRRRVPTWEELSAAVHLIYEIFNWGLFLAQTAGCATACD